MGGESDLRVDSDSGGIVGRRSESNRIQATIRSIVIINVIEIVKAQIRTQWGAR